MYYDFLFEPTFVSSAKELARKWSIGLLKQLLPDIERPDKKQYTNYSGQYDFFLSPNIRIEVKTSRAVEFNKDAPLYIKALSSDSKKSFDMNFQQIKPGCCDVFVWMAVWRDTIKYWVIPSFEVENNPYYSKGQHRGNIGEGQLHLNHENIKDFDKYLAGSTNLEKAIIAAYKKERKLRKR
jgi:hypothetical protein